MTSLHERSWKPEGRPRARVLVVHGYAEHSGRYDSIARHLNKAGVYVDAYDHWGHGRSPGRRGRIDDFGRLVVDLGGQVARVRAEANGTPFFLLAHSMGGLVAAHYLSGQANPVDGAIISSPLLAVPGEVPPWKRKLSGLMSAVAPGLPVEKLRSNAISRDPAVVRAYDNDPLVYHRPICARTGAQLMAAIESARSRLSGITCPLLVLHGTADRLTPFSGGQLLYDTSGSSDKSYYWEDGGYHELFNDNGREAALRVVIDWINRRLSSSD